MILKLNLVFLVIPVGRVLEGRLLAMLGRHGIFKAFLGPFLPLLRSLYVQLLADSIDFISLHMPQQLLLLNGPVLLSFQRIVEIGRKLTE